MSLGHWSDWGDVILCALRWTAYSGKIIGWSRLEEELEDLVHCVLEQSLWSQCLNDCSCGDT